MILIGYIVQFLIVFGWYKFILVNEFKYEHIIRRSIKIFYVHRKNIILSLFGLGPKSKEQTEAIYNIENHLIGLLMETSLLMGYLVSAPLILKCFINYENGKIQRILIYIVFLCVQILEVLKENTQKIVEQINIYTQSVMIPLEKKAELLRFEKIQRRIIKWNVKKILMILLVMIVCIVVLNRLTDSKVFQGVAAIVFVLVMIWKAGVISFPNNIDIVEGINVEGYILESIKEDIENMCMQSGIKSLECKIIATQESYIKTKLSEYGVPQVDISNGFITQIYGNDAPDILLITIAHELGHIYYNDLSNISKRVRISKFVCGGLMILNMLGMMIVMISPVFLIGMLFAICVEMFFGTVMSDTRYWEQIAELRADRFAINVCKGNKKIFVEFWKEYFEKQTKEETNIFDQYYRKYVKVESHPSMKYRMELIEKREKWHWWEYFEHALVIMKWRITYRGWNGI